MGADGLDGCGVDVEESVDVAGSEDVEPVVADPEDVEPVPSAPDDVEPAGAVDCEESVVEDDELPEFVGSVVVTVPDDVEDEPDEDVAVEPDVDVESVGAVEPVSVAADEELPEEVEVSGAGALDSETGVLDESVVDDDESVGLEEGEPTSDDDGSVTELQRFAGRFLRGNWPEPADGF